MHLWIVLAAFAFAAVTPYLSVPARTDMSQIAEEQEEAPSVEADDDERPA